jgi:peptide deformylase
MSLFGDPVLHTPCAPVTDFGPALAALVEDLYATMYAAGGVGLAANQIGVGLRVFVHDCPDDEEVRHLGHVVNPRLVSVDGVTVGGPEGCLSLPGLSAGTERYDIAVVEGVDLHGEPVRVTGTGFFARCLQHETDHLEGRVYAERLTGLRLSRLRRSARRAGLPAGPWPPGPDPEPAASPRG